MNVIEQPNRGILNLLGENPYFKKRKYRFNKFCLIHDYKDVKLIHNAMTCSFVSMTNEEFAKIDLNDLSTTYGTEDFEYVDFLISSYFLVLDEYDEATQTDWLREKLRKVVDDKYLSEVYDYVLYPTTTCNARCFYCYEKPMGKMPMSMEMAEKVAKYILKKAKDKERNIVLRWFGGEPLYNVKAMRHIISTIKNEGRHITSTIISNGYLFSDKLVEEAKTEWNLEHAQITLDGTEEVYNKAKNYIYTNQDKVSPFKKVIDNIERLLNNDIGVSIRMNADMYNADDLKELIKYINERFPKESRNRLAMYVYPIFEDENNPRTDSEKEELYKKIDEIEDVMAECGFYEGNTELGSNIRFHHCMVDGGKTLNIHPDGTLGLCEHFIDSDILGNIEEDIYDYDIINSWRDYITDETCKNCEIYPSCIRTKKCSDLKGCDKWVQALRLKHKKLDLESTYNEYFLKKSNDSRDFSYNIECAANRSNGTCYCVSQICEDKENWCRCISKKENIKEGECYCISQVCDDKENWCYCISKKEETEHKCEGGSCTCKKEKSKSEEVIEVIEVKKDKSFLDKLKDLFK